MSPRGWNNADSEAPQINHTRRNNASSCREYHIDWAVGPRLYTAPDRTRERKEPRREAAITTRRRWLLDPRNSPFESQETRPTDEIISMIAAILTGMLFCRVGNPMLFHFKVSSSNIWPIKNIHLSRRERRTRTSRSRAAQLKFDVTANTRSPRSLISHAKTEINATTPVHLAKNIIGSTNSVWLAGVY